MIHLARPQTTVNSEYLFHLNICILPLNFQNEDIQTTSVLLLAEIAGRLSGSKI